MNSVELQEHYLEFPLIFNMHLRKEIEQTFKMRKPYSAFLIDRPFKKDRVEDPIGYFLNCLRYRLRLLSHSENNGQAGDESSLNAAFMDLQEVLQSMLQPTPNPSISSSTREEVRSSSRSLYDTLLELIDGFDAAGVAEIFRLMLERRSAVPLFSPSSKTKHLALLRHITLPGNNNIRLGEDKSLQRIVVVSCRQRDESETSKILKDLFHIDSLQSYDANQCIINSNELEADVGFGCWVTEESGLQKVQNLIVIHIVGDFRPLWPFISNFADFLLIEDATVEQDRFNPSSLVTENTKDMDSDQRTALTFIPLVWKPSLGNVRLQMKEANGENGFRHMLIEGQLGDKMVETLKTTMNFLMKKETQSTRERKSLFEMTIFFNEEYSELECPSPTEIESSLQSLTSSLGHIKKNEFILQKNYLKQSEYEEAKYERLDKVRENEVLIRNCFLQRREDARKVQDHQLLQLLLKLLANEDPFTRVLSIRLLEKSLVDRSDRELAPLLLDINTKFASYVQLSTCEGSKKETDQSEIAKTNLNVAKMEFKKSVLNIEHVWRELSHVYTAMAPEDRSPQIQSIPRLAAQHLLDGFCLELLDGDSNLMNLKWVKSVLHELSMLVKNPRRERIFVLSVMGLQSSGKSTLLNTMFGIQMRTSVGQCTRGVNMSLLAVEGRPEYDYILLLDTEGTRSPEYYGLPGNEKRDNQMATLSILLADATIIVTPGENDAAIKEILPVVMMAYQRSKLAEENGGRLSSMMFFVYNRIDTTQKDKLSNVIQSLGTSLKEAFDLVRGLTGNLADNMTSILFRDFKMDTSNSNESDVCILGNVKKEFEPPGDIPNSAFGESVAYLREHIHRRVTSPKDGTSWRGRSIDEFSYYIEEVWKCICSANFTLNFASVVERITFDKMDLEYKKVERKLAEQYWEIFGNLKRKMVEEKGENISTSEDIRDGIVADENRVKFYESLLRDKIFPIQQTLDDKIKEIVKVKSREKWSCQLQEIWKLYKIEQLQNWTWSLRTSFLTLFNYEHHVEKYKTKMRNEIAKFFKTESKTEVDYEEKFIEIYRSILLEALHEFPPKDVCVLIEKVYQNSSVIKKRQIDINIYDDDQMGAFNLVGEMNEEKEEPHTSTFSAIKEKCVLLFSNILKRKNREVTLNFFACYQFINKLMKKIAAGKFCYDDSIVSSWICDIDSAITCHHITINSEIQMLHKFGRTQITKLMEEIQKQWEASNSVYAKLLQEPNQHAMQQFFIMSSRGVKKTKLFTSTLANVLIGALSPAFEKEMAQKTSNRIRNERWLHDARFMHKHIDLHLANLLVKKKISQVLDFIQQPRELYTEVLYRLIGQKVPNMEEEWKVFSNYLKKSVEAAARNSVDVANGRAQKFVDELRKELLKGGLSSEHLESALLINFEGEFKDCDNDDEKEFLETCVNELTEAIENYVPFLNQSNLSRVLSPLVVSLMILLNDSAALPRCNACCRMCNAMCIEAANHDTKLRPHDAVHQPKGVSGCHNLKTKELSEKTCSQSYDEDETFVLGDDLEKIYKYRDFSKVFPKWKDPRINEELPLRQYILATYNEDIAKKYSLKPCPNIPPRYFHDLSTIRVDLQRELGL